MSQNCGCLGEPRMWPKCHGSDLEAFGKRGSLYIPGRWEEHYIIRRSGEKKLEQRGTEGFSGHLKTQVLE